MIMIVMIIMVMIIMETIMIIKNNKESDVMMVMMMIVARVFFYCHRHLHLMIIRYEIVNVVTVYLFLQCSRRERNIPLEGR